MKIDSEKCHSRRTRCKLEALRTFITFLSQVSNQNSNFMLKKKYRNAEGTSQWSIGLSIYFAHRYEMQ